ncbi:MAG: XRE family transcriptional regulator [Sorangiineae bacterium PRO1]|nr:XRE family transcriptional regulator [Sorangiineae bacterium PRO1]
MSPRDLRKTIGYSIERTAVAAGVTSPTVRLYEANRQAVTEKTRRKLDALYQRWSDHITSAPTTPSAA